MRFALLGDHPDGHAFAAALQATRRHEVVDCRNGDVEEILADPQIEACIVGVPMTQRLDVARRVLQSERHAAIVHPVDYKPDGAYELNLLQGDVHQVLFPLIVEGLHSQMDELCGQWTKPTDLIDVHFTAPGDVLLAVDNSRKHPVLPGWTAFRKLGGEVAELSTFARSERVKVGEPVAISGTFADGRVFRASYRTEGTQRRVEFRLGDKNPVSIAADDLHWSEAWSKAVLEFETELAFLVGRPKVDPAAGAGERPDAKLSWKDAVRALELDDAAARSLAKRRSTLLEYQDASEEVGFKGTMTLLGCGMLWMLVVVVAVATWYPPLFWVTLPILFGFLGLQLFRWALPSRKS